METGELAWLQADTVPFVSVQRLGDMQVRAMSKRREGGIPLARYTKFKREGQVEEVIGRCTLPLPWPCMLIE